MRKKSQNKHESLVATPNSDTGVESKIICF